MSAKFYDCYQALAEELKIVQHELIEALASNRALVNFVMAEVKFLELSRQLAINNGEVESRQKADGIKDATDWLKIITEQAFPASKNKEEETG